MKEGKRDHPRESIKSCRKGGMKSARKLGEEGDKGREKIAESGYRNNGMKEGK